LPSPSWIGIWQDNYFALLPGESREITATSNVRDLGRAAAVVELECWNVKRRALG
jgi:exo-1,4-beta-D-glucosaminidase